MDFHQWAALRQSYVEIAARGPRVACFSYGLLPRGGVSPAFSRHFCPGAAFRPFAVDVFRFGATFCPLFVDTSARCSRFRPFFVSPGMCMLCVLLLLRKDVCPARNRPLFARQICVPLDRIDFRPGADFAGFLHRFLLRGSYTFWAKISARGQALYVFRIGFRPGTNYT